MQLVVLAAATFIYVTAELLPVGALPSIAQDLHVSIVLVGGLLSSYALVAALTSAWAFPLGFGIAIEGWRTLQTIPDAHAALMTALGLASAGLVAWTDVRLVLDWRRTQTGSTGPAAPPTGSVSGT